MALVGEAEPATGQTASTSEAPARGRRLASRTTATALGVALLMLGATSVLQDGLTHHYLTDGGRLIVILIYAAVGVVVARRQPRNPVGWLLLIAIFLFVLSSEATSYVVQRYHLGHTKLPLGPVALVVQSLWVPAVALFPLVFLFFPDGRLPSRRWRWVFWTYVGLAACATTLSLAPAISAAVHDNIHVDSSGNLTGPGQKTGAVASAATFLIVISIGLMWVSFVVQKFLSWRRSSGERRQQLKWLAFGATLTLVFGILGSVADNGLFVGIVALPVAIGVGILKFRLYDIDRVAGMLCDLRVSVA